MKGSVGRGKFYALRAIAAGPLVVFYRMMREHGAETLRVLDRRKDVEELFGGERERR